MSGYLGFRPTDNANYYFISYNSDDAQRVRPIAQQLYRSGVPLWYDNGLKYGEKWEDQIAEKLKDSQAVILFFTKEILQKEQSYVRNEFVMASRHFHKKIYVVMMDNIADKDVPHSKVAWWISIQELQCIKAFDPQSIDTVIPTILEALGLASMEDRMDQTIRQYKELYETHQYQKAEQYLSEYLHSKAISERAMMIATLAASKLSGASPCSFAKEVSDSELQNRATPLVNHVGNPIKSLYECYRAIINEQEWVIGNNKIFRGSRCDAHVIQFWRDGIYMYTIPKLADAYELQVFYDQNEALLFVVYLSWPVPSGDCADTLSCSFSVCVVENPSADPIFHHIPFLLPRK